MKDPSAAEWLLAAAQPCCWDASNSIRLHENEHCTLFNVFIPSSDVWHRMNFYPTGSWNMESKALSAPVTAGNISKSTVISWEVLIEEVTWGDNSWEQAPWTYWMIDYPRKAESAVPSATPSECSKRGNGMNPLKETLDTSPSKCSVPKVLQLKADGLLWNQLQIHGHFVCWVNPWCLMAAESQIDWGKKKQKLTDCFLVYLLLTVPWLWIRHSSLSHTQMH